MKSFFNEKQFVANQEKSSDILQLYRNKAKSEKIDDHIQKFPIAQKNVLNMRKSQKRQIRAYFAQVLNYMMSRAYGCDCAYALLDEEGYLIRLNATENIYHWLESKGIILGSVWKWEKVGPNAVTIGLKENRTLSSAGSEN